jgi:type II secretory pathway pseudopilin PulG
MTEMLVVIAVVAILALMAVPALTRLVPVQRVRSESQSVATFMRQARLTAANTQKPVRVTLFCPAARAAGAPPCRLFMQTASYDFSVPGGLVNWRPEQPPGHEMARQVFPERARVSGSNTPLYTYTDDGGGTGTPSGMFWAIFMPNGRVFSNPRPFALNFHADDLGGRDGPNWWLLEVDNGTGRAALTRP